MRYIIGIDLGTTNSCVAYVDTQDVKAQDVKATVQLMKIPQRVAAGSIEALATLPSFCYLSAPYESMKGAVIVGQFAKAQGAKVPTRLVQSAKSWMCHPAANRRDKILPVEAADESMRISPVEASAKYISHIQAAWDAEMARGDIDAEFCNQEIVLTVPASFDEVARSLTVEAARKAGCLHLTLLEEPQAAFYSWIAQHEKQWETLFQAGTQVLVCDVGGGTTDFSLIEVVSTDGKLAFQRMAVGDHLLLGGDNMDAAIAHHLETKLTSHGHELTSSQRLQLLHAAREAKEELLSSASRVSQVVLQGTGSGVVQGTVSVEISRAELEALLMEGFFQQHPWDEALKLRKTAGIRSMGLPYEDEPSITKHLARFLWENRGESGIRCPDFVLFNGGVMKPLQFQQAIVNTLQEWFPGKKLAVLDSYHLDLAVARGAAYYGKVRRGMGVKIGGGLARGYYIVVDTKNSKGTIVQKALTLMPRGSEEGDQFEPALTFLLTPNTPLEFRVGSSHVRLHDKAGDLVDVIAEEMQFLPPLRTVMRVGKGGISEASQEKIPVHLVAKLTPIGTLEIGLKALKTEHRWALEFQVRSATGQQDIMGTSVSASDKQDQTFDASFLQEAVATIQQVYSPGGSTLKPKQIMEKIEALLGVPRKEWPPSVIRGLADVVLKSAEQRKLSQEHRERWWNLVGFLLRPGFGCPVDDFRMKELWKVILSDSKGTFSMEQQMQMWICYRRTAGGMSKGQQIQLGGELAATLLSKRSGKIEIKSKADLYPYSEKVRAVAAMELLEVSLKTQIGTALAARIAAGEGMAADYWALGRIGARHLLYGSIVNVVPKQICEEWLERVLDVPCKDEKQLEFLIEQLARKTEHREINVSSRYVEKILTKFNHPRLEALLMHENRLTQSEREMAFGDGLPAGLLLEL